VVRSIFFHKLFFFLCCSFSCNAFSFAGGAAMGSTQSAAVNCWIDSWKRDGFTSRLRDGFHVCKCGKRGAPVDADLSAHLSAQIRGDVGTANPPYIKIPFLGALESASGRSVSWLKHPLLPLPEFSRCELFPDPCRVGLRKLPRARPYNAGKAVL
jgi:hypothetical protein